MASILRVLSARAFNSSKKARGAEHHMGGWWLALISSDLCPAYLTYTKAGSFQSLRSAAFVFKCLFRVRILKWSAIVIQGICEVSSVNSLIYVLYRSGFLQFGRSRRKGSHIPFRSRVYMLQSWWILLFICYQMPFYFSEDYLWRLEERTYIHWVVVNGFWHVFHWETHPHC